MRYRPQRDGRGGRGRRLVGPRPMCGVSWLGYGGRFVLRDDWESSEAALLRVEARHEGVEATAVTFTDSSGMSALLQARGLAFVDHVAFRIRDPLPRLRRPVEASGIEDLPLPDERWPPSPRGAATWTGSQTGESVWEPASSRTRRGGSLGFGGGHLLTGDGGTRPGLFAPPRARL